MGKLKQLAGDTAIYGLSSIFGRAINFLLVPFYTSTQILSIAEYGIVSELYAYAAVLNVVFLYGLETAFFRFVSRYPEKRKQVFSTAQSSILITSAFLFLLMTSYATPIVKWLEFPGNERFIYWFAMILTVDAMAAIPFAYLRYERKAWKFASFKMINILLNVFFNVFFLYFCKNVYAGNFLESFRPMVQLVYNPAYNVEYVFISNLIANAMYIVMLWPVLIKTRLRLDWGMLKPMLIYAYPLLFSQLAGVTNEMFSRMTLKKMLPVGFYPGLTSQEALSIFAACYKLAIFMTLAIQAFRFAAEPFFFAQSHNADSKITYSKVYYYFILAGTLATLVISLNLDWIKLLFLSNSTYWQGLHIVPILLVANLFLGVYFNISIWFKITDKTYFGTLISVAAAVITIVLNILLIPKYGYEGSAVATLVTYMFMSISVYLLGQKYFPVPYDIKKTGLYFLAGLALLFVGWNINVEPAWLQISLKELPVLFFVGLILDRRKKNIKIKYKIIYTFADCFNYTRVLE